MAENSMRDAILSVVEAKGGSAEGVGPLDRDALDRLLDVMAGSDQPVTSGMSDAQVVRALAQYAHGGGGGVDVGNPVTIEVVSKLPEPGGYLGDYGSYINKALYDNRPIVLSYRNSIGGAASGMTVHTGDVSTSGISFYKATYDSNEVYTSFESIEISATELTVDPPRTGYYYEFIVPEMGENESLFVVCAIAS